MSSPGENTVHLLYATAAETPLQSVDDALQTPVRSERVDSKSAAADAVATARVDCVVTTAPNDDIAAFAHSVRADNASLPIVYVADTDHAEAARAAAAAGVTYVPATAEDDTALLATCVGDCARQERDRRQAAARRERIERTSQHLESLFESVPLPVIELDSSGTVLRWNRGAEDTFGWSSEEAVGQRVPIVPESESAAFEQRLERLLDGQRVRGAEVVARTKDDEELSFLLSAAPVPDADGQAGSITVVLNDISAQKRMEQRLRELQETARQLGVAPSITTISEIATEAAEDVLGLEVTGLWRYDEHEHVLRPVAITPGSKELIPETPTFSPGDSLSWTAFEEGEVHVYRDLQTVPDRYNVDSKIRSEIIVPLGEEGVLVTGSTEPRQFSEADVDLFRILGATVEAALVRATREEQLRRQNERLEQFADVLAHDLRNPLTTAQGFLELAEESGDSEQFERVEAAHDRMNQLIDDLLTLARADATVADPEPIDIGEAATAAWSLVDTGELSLETHEPPTVSGDPGRLRQLFENLFRNTVEHGASSSASADDTVGGGASDGGESRAGSSEPTADGELSTVSVGPLPDGDGFYVADDGVGIPEARREEVFDHGVSFSDDGTGFGLSIVADIVRAHGWTVSVGESAEGGARFEFSVDGGRGNT